MARNNSITSPPPPNGVKRKNQLPGVVDVPIIHMLYDAYHLWHKVIIKFPKAERYTLGQTCSNTLLLLFEHILAASTNKDKKTKQDNLNEASVKLDMLRILIRLAKDCDCLENKSYLDFQSKLHKIGKMLGGWIKSIS